MCKSMIEIFEAGQICKFGFGLYNLLVKLKKNMKK